MIIKNAIRSTSAVTKLNPSTARLCAMQMRSLRRRRRSRVSAPLFQGEGMLYRHLRLRNKFRTQGRISQNILRE